MPGGRGRKGCLAHPAGSVPPSRAHCVRERGVGPSGAPTPFPPALPARCSAAETLERLPTAAGWAGPFRPRQEGRGVDSLTQKGPSQHQEGKEDLLRAPSPLRLGRQEFGVLGTLGMWRQHTACPALKRGQRAVARGRQPLEHCHKCGGPQGCGRGLTWVASAKLSTRLSHRTHGVTDHERPNSSPCCCELSPAQGPGAVVSPLHHSPQPRPPQSLTTVQTPAVTHHSPDPHGHPSHPGTPACTLDPPGHPLKSGHPSH